MLGNVIRPISEAEARKLRDTESRRVVWIDRKNGRILDRRPLLAFNSDLACYLVLNSSDPAHVAHDTIRRYKLGDFDTQLSLAISIQYAASCPPGNEGALALALLSTDGDPPGKVFEDSIYRSMDLSVQHMLPPTPPGQPPALVSFCRNAEENLDALRRRVLAELKEKTGLSLELRVTLDQREQLIPLENTGVWSLIPSDFEEEVEVATRYRIGLIAGQEVLALLFLSRQHQLEERIRKTIGEYARSEVTLEQLIYDFDDGVRPRIIERLNGMLGEFGRRIEYLSLKPVGGGILPGITMKLDVMTDLDAYRAGKGSEKVVIKNELKVEPDRSKVARFRKSGITDRSTLIQYFEKNLKDAVRDAMFGKSYANILMRFGDVQSAIKHAMEQHSSAIGYHLQLITSVPNLEPFEWTTHGFTLETTGAETEFATSVSVVKVRLAIILTAKMSDLTKVERMLIAGEDVLAAMRKRIVDRIAYRLHVTTPEEYYTRFEHAGPPEGIGLKSQLEEEVRALLWTEFGVLDASVVVKRLETEVLKRIHDLQRAMGRFTVTLKSFQDMETQVTVQGQFRVLGVRPDLWARFHIREHSIGEIQEFFERALQIELETLTTAHVAYTQGAHRQDLQSWLQAKAQEYLASEFGLHVSLSFVGRLPTAAEEKWNELQETRDRNRAIQSLASMANDVAIESNKASRKLASIEAKEKQLAAIRESIRKLSVSPDDYDEVNELEAQEDKLEREIDELHDQLRKENVLADRDVDKFAPRYHRGGPLSFPDSGMPLDRALPSEGYRSDSAAEEA